MFAFFVSINIYRILSGCMISFRFLFTNIIVISLLRCKFATLRVERES